jgi:SAM-dependent methyltransferase
VTDGPRPWDGAQYQRALDALAAEGRSMHGEADLVAGLGPTSVLDAGCGTGRVAIELARRGIEVVGTDIDPSMLETAAAQAPDLTWVAADLANLDLGRTFDVVVMAGNVPLFTPAGTQAAIVAGCARHVADGGALVSGFSLGRGYEVADLDEHAAAAGLTLAGRWSRWDGEPFTESSDYAVSVHRRTG